MSIFDVFRNAVYVADAATDAENRDEYGSYVEGVNVTSNGIIPPSRTSGQTVTTNTALSLTEVYRAVSIIQTAVGQLSLDVYRNDALIASPAWLRQPDVKLSRSDFLKQTTVSLALDGNAYWRLIMGKDSKGNPVISALICENPFDVTVEADRLGNAIGYRIAGFERVFRPEEVQHLTLFPVPGQARGLGPIQAARTDLRGALDLRDYAADVFNTGGVPSGILKTDQNLSKEAAEDFRDRWNQAGYGTRVLANGLDYKPVLLPPEDVQFLENRNFTAVQIARLFGIPARLMLLDAGSEDYANVEQADAQFVKWSLAAYTRAIEEAFSNLLPRTSVVRFNLDAFVRADTKTRYEAHAIALASGFMTVNEVRGIEGLPPIPGGDSASAASAPVAVTPPAPSDTPTEQS